VLRASFLPFAAIIVVAACSDTSGPLNPPTPSPSVEDKVVDLWESNAPVYWNTVSRQLAAASRFNALQAIRGYSIVSLAQYNAAIAAEQQKDRSDHPSVHAAIAAASVVALSYLHPADAAALEARLDAYLVTKKGSGPQHDNAEMGEAIGREIAAQVVARAQGDGFFAPWTGTVPTGPGKWVNVGAPVGPMVGQAKPYFLTSGSQFRPAPPPAFGSAAFNSALAEVRQIADTSTPAQTASAVFWNLPAGTHQPPGFWNEEAATLAVRYRLDERETAHTMALMNMVSYDAFVASHEAKYFYWLIRPSQADAGIVLPIGLPNFPSYPSNHASISAGMARVLGARFPWESARLEALADEAALSRVYGGIHYRIDGEVGLALGRSVAAWGVAHDVASDAPFILK
jgi:membrane-associated phospholipid phosphatase